MRGPSLGIVFATFVLTGIASGAAAADDPESLIQKAIELRRSNDDEGALKLLERAYAIQKSPRAAAQIGFAEQALGRWSRADRHLREALGSPDDPWIRKNRATIDGSLKVIETHIGHLQVTGSPAGAEVLVDGELVGRLPLRDLISVTSGSVAVEVRADGYLPILRGTTVVTGQLARENFQLQPFVSTTSPPAGSTSPVTTTAVAGVDATGAEGAQSSGSGEPAGTTTTAPAHADDEGGVSRSAIAYGVGGLAAASLVFGIVEHLRWQNKTSTFNDDPACDSGLLGKGGTGCQGLYDDGQRARTLAFVGYGGAAAFLATAAVLFLTDPHRHEDRPQQVACAPVGGATSAGLNCRLDF